MPAEFGYLKLVAYVPNSDFGLVAALRFDKVFFRISVECLSWFRFKIFKFRKKRSFFVILKLNKKSF